MITIIVIIILLLSGIIILIVENKKKENYYLTLGQIDPNANKYNEEIEINSQSAYERKNKSLKYPGNEYDKTSQRKSFGQVQSDTNNY